jgi:hypothetical protein
LQDDAITDMQALHVITNLYDFTNDFVARV